MKTSLTIFFLILTNALFAQGDVSMADTLRSNGKIYVVVAVILTILIGLVLYLMRLDRKITRLEKTELHNKK